MDHESTPYDPSGRVGFGVVDNLALQVLGEPFLCYVLNASTADLAARFGPEYTRLDPLREAHIRQLLGLLRELAPQVQERNLPWSLSLGGLGKVLPGLGTTWPNASRQACGGLLETPPEVEQAVERTMLLLARDVYPIFLLPSEDARFSIFLPSIGAPLWTHPLKDELERDVLSDPTLGRLFPDVDKQSGWAGGTFRTTGTGGGVQLWAFPEQILRAAWEIARLKRKVPTLAQFSTGVLDALKMLRAGIEDKTRVPVRIRLTGVLLPEHSSLDLGWGVLRPIGEADTDFVPTGSSPGVTTTTPEGETIFVHYAGDVVLETTMKYRVAVTAGGDGDGPTLDRESLAEMETLERRLRITQLALLLALGAESSVRLIVASRSIIDPLAHAVLRTWRDSAQLPSISPMKLSTSQSKDWESWVKKIDKHPASIDIAIQRTLLAANERQDPADVLIDSVIAWENMVGASNQGEPTLRVAWGFRGF